MNAKLMPRRVADALRIAVVEAARDERHRCLDLIAKALHHTTDRRTRDALRGLRTKVEDGNKEL